MTTIAERVDLLTEMVEQAIEEVKAATKHKTPSEREAARAAALDVIARSVNALADIATSAESFAAALGSAANVPEPPA